MSSKPKAKTLADFRAAHDDDVIIPARLQAQLAAMQKIGPEEYDYEIDFLRNAKVGNAKISAYRERFAKHIVVTREGKKAWFADPKVAAKARGE